MPSPLSILKRLFRRSIDSNVDRAKEDWEFNWQRVEWLEQFKKPETQLKCKEYWVKYRHLDDILTHVELDETSTILDVGCGLSSVLHFLPGKRIGIDPNGDRYLEIYDYPPGIEVRKGYGEKLDWPESTFDFVTCSNCIDHMSDPRAAMKEIHRVLKKNAYLALTCEVFNQDLGKRNVGHPHSMTVDQLISLGENFKLIEHWDSAWFGLKNYAEGQGPTDQREHIFLLQRED